MSSGAGTQPRTFRLPRSAYLIVLFLVFGTIPLAFTAANFSFDGKGAAEGAPGVVGWQSGLLVIPVLVAVFVARTATFVDGSGIRIRALFGSRQLSWDEIEGLSLGRRNVYAVTSGGSWRLPCVHVRDLAQLSRASEGRLPELADPTPKYESMRRRRRWPSALIRTDLSAGTSGAARVRYCPHRRITSDAPTHHGCRTTR